MSVRPGHRTVRLAPCAGDRGKDNAEGVHKGFRTESGCLRSQQCCKPLYWLTNISCATRCRYFTISAGPDLGATASTSGL